MESKRRGDRKLEWEWKEMYQGVNNCKSLKENSRAKSLLTWAIIIESLLCITQDEHNHLADRLGQPVLLQLLWLFQSFMLVGRPDSPLPCTCATRLSIPTPGFPCRHCSMGFGGTCSATSQAMKKHRGIEALGHQPLGMGDGKWNLLPPFPSGPFRDVVASHIFSEDVPQDQMISLSWSCGQPLSSPLYLFSLPPSLSRFPFLLIPASLWWLSQIKCKLLPLEL